MSAGKLIMALVMQRTACVLALAAIAAAAPMAPAHAQKLTSLEQRGQTLLTRLCADCHAVGPRGISPHLLAPPFRSIAERYDIADLIDQLQEGFTAPHPDMPTFTFSRRDARAVQAYLNAIQK
jgi:mono/diheme cytochrome c family protein